MDKLCQELTGIEEARNLTEEDIVESKYWEDEKKSELIFIETPYWLSTRWANPYSSSNCYFGLEVVQSGGVNIYGLCSSYGDSGNGTYALRPVVSVKI